MKEIRFLQNRSAWFFPLILTFFISGCGGENLHIQASPDTDISYSLIGGYLGENGNNLDQDPLFVNAAAGNYRLGSGSPAIDAGNNDRLSAWGLSPILVDLDGNTRIIGTTVDMGAYEASSP